MSTETTAKPKAHRAPIEFVVIESYERMLEQRERDPRAYELQHSLNEKRALEHYVIAKQRAEAKR
jgi:hypothetical protein